MFISKVKRSSRIIVICLLFLITFYSALADWSKPTASSVNYSIVNTNSSNYWDNYDTANTTQFELQQGNQLGIIWSWIRDLIISLSSSMGFYNNTNQQPDYSILSYTENITNFNHSVSVFNNETINDVNISFALSLEQGQVASIISSPMNVESGSNITAILPYSTTRKLIYNWLRNGNPLTVLNMPFEGINGTVTNNSWDYSGYGHHGKDNGDAYWNATGGYDSKGAYRFFGTNDYIEISDSAHLNFFNKSWTASFWVNQNTVGAWRVFIGKSSNVAANNFRLFGSPGNGLRLYYGADAGGDYTGSAGTIPNAGQWYHLVYGVNAENKTIRYAINGVIENKFVATIFPVNNTLNLRIGTDTVNAYDFDGQIDEVMFFNRSLSDEEIVAIFNNKTHTIVAQETTASETWFSRIYVNNGTQDIGQLDTNNVKIVNSDIAIPIENVDDYNLTAYLTAGSGIKNIYNWLINGNSITVLNMPFEGINGTATDNAWDYSGYGNNGSENGGVLWNATGGYDGKGAYQFDGINDYISLKPQSTNLNLTGGFSVCAWIKAGNNLGANRIINSIVGGSHMNGLGGASANQARFEISNGTSGCASSPTAYTGNWEHYCGVYNGVNRNISFHVNGALLSSTNCTASPFMDYWEMGRLEGAALQFFNGTIDDVMIFNRSLSAEQVYALWQNRTDVIVANETNLGDLWTSKITQNNGTSDIAQSITRTALIKNDNIFLDTSPILEETRIPMGEIYIENNTIPVSITGAGIWTIVNSSAWFGNPDSMLFQNYTNGTLEYVGEEKMFFHIATTLSLSSEGANDVMRASVFKNGVILPGSQIQQKLFSVGDVGSTAIHIATTLSKGDRLNLYVLNQIDADDLTISYANMFAMGQKIG